MIYFHFQTFWRGMNSNCKSLYFHVVFIIFMIFLIFIKFLFWENTLLELLYRLMTSCCWGFFSNLQILKAAVIMQLICKTLQIQYDRRISVTHCNKQELMFCSYRLFYMFYHFTGKTVAFMLPILERLLYKPKHSSVTRVLILVPTRELAIQVHTVGKQLANYTNIEIILAAGMYSIFVFKYMWKKNKHSN